jgi:hypothetical protein
MYPPGGQAPFGLPSEYDFVWADVDSEQLLDSWYDETQCARTYDRGEGDLGFTECDGGEGSDWRCRCYEGADTYDWIEIPAYFVDTSVNNGEACRLATAVCLTELPPANPNCYDSGEWGGYSAQSCTRDDRCDYHHSTPNGDIVKSVLMPFVDCSSFDEPGYRCLGRYIAGFDIVGVIDAVPGRTFHETCDVGYQVFFHGVDPGTEGPQSCEPVSAPTVEVTGGNEHSCDAAYECRRPAATNGEAIELVYPYKTVGCYRSADEWRCWCSDELGNYTWSGVDGVTACNNALTECMSHPVP